MSPRYINLKTKWYIFVPIIVAGLAILMVSIIKTSWINLSDDSNFDRFRINPVEFETGKEEGWEGEEKVTYCLPQVNQLPGQFFYPIKRIRDNIWLKMSLKDKDGAKLYLLLADKKIAELLVLSQTKPLSEKYMYDCAKTAVDYLFEANKLSGDMDNIIEAKKISDKVDVAKYFYDQIFKQIGKMCSNEDKYKKLSEQVLIIETKND